MPNFTKLGHGFDHTHDFLSKPKSTVIGEAEIRRSILGALLGWF
jgi:hypothetical protein